MIVSRTGPTQQDSSNPNCFEIYRPINFEFDGSSAASIREFERICCLSDTIIRKMSREKRYRENGQMPLHSKILKDLIGREYKSVIDASIKTGLIKREGGYIIGKKSYEYSLAEEYSAGFVKHNVTDTYVKNSLKRRQQRHCERQQRLIDTFDRKEVHKTLHSNLFKISLSSGRIPSGKNQVATAFRKLQAEEIRQRKWRATFDEQGRLHTNLTNLPREMRKLLRVGETRLAAIDISASQPTFMLMLRQQLLTNEFRDAVRSLPSRFQNLKLDEEKVRSLKRVASGHEKSWEEWKADIENGCFYERIQRALSKSEGEDFPLKEIKKRTLTVLYWQRDRYMPICSVLRSIYPGPMKLLDELKSFPNPFNDAFEEAEEDHAMASRLLQYMESNFVFNSVVPCILQNKPKLFIATIHDAVVTTQKNANYVKSVMERCFDRVGLSARLKIEDFYVMLGTGHDVGDRPWTACRGTCRGQAMRDGGMLGSTCRGLRMSGTGHAWRVSMSGTGHAWRVSMSGTGHAG